jgi:hypothetical protein
VLQLAFRHPLGEDDLGKELRLHPMHAAPRQPVAREPRTRDLQLRERVTETLQCFGIEPGPDLARI